MAISALSHHDLDALADDLSEAMPALDPTEQRVAVALYRLLATGLPVEPGLLSQRAGVPAPRVAELLSAWPGVYRDDQGRVIGFWGLSVAAMPPHQFEVAGKRLWTWCAFDALFIPAILGASAHVASTCPTTGAPISMVVSPQGVTERSPAGSVVSFLRPERQFDYDVILSFCHHVLFFASDAAGRQWTSQRPNAFLLTLDQGFKLGRRLVRRRFGAQ